MPKYVPKQVLAEKKTANYIGKLMTRSVLGSSTIKRPAETKLTTVPKSAVGKTPARPTTAKPVVSRKIDMRPWSSKGFHNKAQSTVVPARDTFI